MFYSLRYFHYNILEQNIYMYRPGNRNKSTFSLFFYFGQYQHSVDKVTPNITLRYYDYNLLVFLPLFIFLISNDVERLSCSSKLSICLSLALSSLFSRSRRPSFSSSICCLSLVNVFLSFETSAVFFCNADFSGSSK